VTEQELQGMKQELALFQINTLKKLGELDKIIGEFQQAHTGLERLGTLEDRVKVLEEARKRQIDINARLLSPQEARKEPTKVPIKEVKSFWPWR